jgi:hypothetical protein
LCAICQEKSAIQELLNQKYKDMSVKKFMLEKETSIKEIINRLSKPFDSHTFIQTFSKEFQKEYVQLLTEYDEEPFIKVHSQIGRFLSENQAELGIQSNGKVLSANIFGEQSENEEWK